LHTFHDYNTKTTLLGKQWAVSKFAGNAFFRPISSLGFLGYAFSAYSSRGGATGMDWRAFALAAAMHGVVILHSAVNLQPMNEKLVALGKGDVNFGRMGPEEMLRRWGRLNWVRAFVPVIAGGAALWQLVR
jgi:hypothetical protein